MRLGWFFVLAAAAVGTQCGYPEYRFGPEGTAGAGGGGGAGGEPVTAGTAGVEAGGAAGAGTGAVAGAGGQSGAAGDGGSGGEGGVPPALCLEGASTDCECRTLTNGRVYEFCTIPVSRDVAQVSCEADGGTLVRFDNGTENGVVALAMNETLMVPNSAWMQATDLEPDAEWTWNDGTVLFTGGAGGVTAPGQYSNWANYEPSGGGGCTIVRWDGSWDDINCGNTFSFVCEQIEP